MPAADELHDIALQNRMTVENLWCNQELQKGNQYQPVVAPGASLARASNLARISLARRSTLALSKMSGSLELTRMSRSLERMSKPLGRVSHMDHAAQMAIGRVRRACSIRLGYFRMLEAFGLPF